MNWAFWIFIFFAVCYGVAYCVLAYKTGRFRRTVLLCSAAGVLALVLICLLSPLTGIRLPINWWTFGSAASVGLPAVVAMLMAGLIF